MPLLLLPSRVAPPPAPPQPIKDSAALKLGLVDEVVPGGQEALLAAARAYALSIAESKRPRLQSLYRTDK